MATRHADFCCPPGRGPGFRRTPGCPRCTELTNGAAARPAHAGNEAMRRNAEQKAADAIGWRRHVDSGEHLRKCLKGNPLAPSTCYEW